MTTLIPKFDFKNGGSTPSGAINRAINLKLAETISVKDFGAVGDGVTNDTNACQNAWNAVKALGGGVLYFPNGTYLCNIVGAGSDNVSIQGEGGGSIVLSYAANAFAVKYDTGFPSTALFVSDICFKDSTAAKTKHGLYVNTGTGLALNNVLFDGLGIGFCNNGTWGFKFDSVKFSNIYCSIFSTCSTGANTSITNVNGQTVAITDAYFPQHPGIQLYENCLFSGFSIGLYYEQPDNPYQAEADVKFLRCTFAPTNGCSTYFLDAGWVHPVSFDNTWFEGTYGTPAIRSLTLPATDIYSNKVNINVSNGFTPKVTINSGAICKFQNCSTNGDIAPYFLNTAPSSFIGQNIIVDEGVLPFYCEEVQNLRDNRSAGFFTTPKINSCRGFNGTSFLFSNDCFAASPLLSAFGATVTHVTSDSIFSTKECNQVVAALNNGVYLGSATSTSTAKIIVYTFAAKSLGSSFSVNISQGGNFTIYPNFWNMYAVVGTYSSTTINPLMLNRDSSSQTWLMSGIQCLQFDTYSEAARFLASGTFNIA